jgi:pilus assembly protein Flp/PilA
VPDNRLRCMADSDEGASAVEYGLLVAAIAAIIILVVFALGGFVKGAFKTTCDGFAGSGQVSTTITSGTATCSG